MLHQIWIGPRPMPAAWMHSWRDAHPSWIHRIWDERSIYGFDLRNRELYERCCDEELFDAAADVARVEILDRLGGVYVDADSTCRRSLDGAVFLEAGFFAVHEPTPLADDLITNAFMGARPGHHVLQRYVETLARVSDPKPQWRRTGPLALTEAIRAGNEPDIEILPAWTFMTRTVRGEPVTGGRPYGEHFFSSTAERSPRWEGARSYPI